jgi:hypothetical protein
MISPPCSAVAVRSIRPESELEIAVNETAKSELDHSSEDFGGTRLHRRTREHRMDRRQRFNLE